MPATTDDLGSRPSRLRRSLAVGAAATAAGPPRRRRPHTREPGGHVDHRRVGPRRRVAPRRHARARVGRPRRFPTDHARVGHPGRPPSQQATSGRCRRRRAQLASGTSAVPGIESSNSSSDTDTNVREVLAWSSVIGTLSFGGHGDHRCRGLRHQRPPAARDRRSAVVERGARWRDPALAGAAGIVGRARRIAARRRRRPRRRSGAPGTHRATARPRGHRPRGRSARPARDRRHWRRGRVLRRAPAGPQRQPRAGDGCPRRPPPDRPRAPVARAARAGVVPRLGCCCSSPTRGTAATVGPRSWSPAACSSSPACAAPARSPSTR